MNELRQWITKLIMPIFTFIDESTGAEKLCDYASKITKLMQNSKPWITLKPILFTTDL